MAVFLLKNMVHKQVTAERDLQTGRFVKGKQIINDCLYCGNTVVSKPSQAYKYCNRECFNMAKTKYPKMWKCGICDKEFPKDRCSNVRKYCSKECSNIAAKGRKQPEWFSEYRREEFLKNNPMKNPLIVKKVVEATRGKKRTLGQRIKMSLTTKNRGENHYNWKGGKDRDKLMLSIRHNVKYYIWRDFVLDRDCNRCTECDSTDKLHAHHILELSKLVDRFCILNLEQALNCDALWDIENGQTLCSLCHNNKHYKIINKTLVEGFNKGS